MILLSLLTGLSGQMAARASTINEFVYEAFAHPDLKPHARTVASTCMIAGAESALATFDNIVGAPAKLTPLDYCLSVFAAADAHKIFVPELESYDRKDSRLTSAYSFALGFALGIAKPEEYATYADKATEAFLTPISEACITGQGENRKDCVIAGAIHAIRAEADLKRLKNRYPSQ
jgi:hypothetical protein